MSEQSNPFRISPVEGPEGKGVRIEFDVETVRGPKQLKRATFGAFEILCDESAMIGGTTPRLRRSRTSPLRSRSDCSRSSLG